MYQRTFKLVTLYRANLSWRLATKSDSVGRFCITYQNDEVWHVWIHSPFFMLHILLKSLLLKQCVMRFCKVLSRIIGLELPLWPASPVRDSFRTGPVLTYFKGNVRAFAASRLWWLKAPFTWLIDWSLCYLVEDIQFDLISCSCPTLDNQCKWHRFSLPPF